MAGHKRGNSRGRPLADALRVRAEDAEDLTVLSACLQDALVAVRDIAYFPGERRLAMLVNRYRWEGAAESEPGGERVLCAVALDGVRQVRRRGIDQTRPGHLLSLLAIRAAGFGAGAGAAPAAGAAIEFLFAGDAAIRVELDRLLLRAEDMEEPYPTAWRPHHPADDDPAGPKA